MPFVALRNCDGERDLAASGPGEDADEADDVRVWRLCAERIFCFQLEEIGGVAKGDFCFEGEFAAQISKELCAWAGLANDEGAGSADVHDIIGGEFCRERGRTKSPVAADVDAAKEDDERHAAILAGALN